MAKKKAPGPVPSPDTLPAPARRRATKRSSVAPVDRSPATGTTSTTAEEVQLAVAHETAPRMNEMVPASSGQGTGPRYEDIAEAAYQRYLSRGGSHGQDWDDWLAAERELRNRTR